MQATYARPGTHAKWEKKRVREGLCVKCPKPRSERSGRFCEEHRLWHNAKSRKHYKDNKSACNRRSKISGHRARVRVMVLLGGLFCTWCKEDDYRVLTIDHIKGHATPVKGRTRTRRGLTTEDLYNIESGRAALTDFRVLCANCQSRHEHLRGKRKVYPEIAQAVLEAGGKLPKLGDEFTVAKKSMPSGSGDRPCTG